VRNAYVWLAQPRKRMWQPIACSRVVSLLERSTHISGIQLIWCVVPYPPVWSFQVTHKLIDNLKLFHELAGPVFGPGTQVGARARGLGTAIKGYEMGRAETYQRLSKAFSTQAKAMQ